jgi:hypothetical protein
MPNYKPLTQEEKEQIKQKFNDIITKYNAAFKQACLTELDITAEEAKLEERMNNEEMVARYRIGQEINAKDEACTKAFDEAKGNLVFKEDFLDRSIKFLLKTDGTPESKEYNKKLLKAYADHPVEMAHNRIKNMMNYDPTPLIDISTDKVKAAEFYRDNMALCMEANEFGGIFGQKHFGVSPLLYEARESMAGMIQNMNYVSCYLPEANGMEFFAMPVLSKDKANLIYNNAKKVFDVDKVPKDIQNVLRSQRGDYDSKISTKEFYDKLREKGVKVDKNVFLKYKFVQTDPETNKQKLVGVYSLIAGKPNITVVERSKDEMLRLNEVSKAFQDKYRAEFQARLGNRRQQEFNMENIETEMKGGFFARIFRKPSNEFKEYMAALKEYNDPASKNYLNRDNLKTKGEAYMTHVNRSGKPIERMDALRQKRANMVKDTLAVVDKMEKDDSKIRGEINKSINELLPKELGVPKNSAIENENDLDDFVLMEKDNKIDFSIEVDDEKSVESA